MLQLPTDVEIKIADTIGKCNQYGLEILNYLKISFSGYLAVGFDSENPVSFIPNHPQPHVSTQIRAKEPNMNVLCFAFNHLNYLAGVCLADILCR